MRWPWAQVPADPAPPPPTPRSCATCAHFHRARVDGVCAVTWTCTPALHRCDLWREAPPASAPAPGDPAQIGLPL